ncbi:hypothetical protein TWF481_003435 [Arthrobotrys musiformis]|uniref:Uncharacterized protein n=1 Tax=Arthrobotrys musiformis TaxID=47236 RepID=A0AAV9VT71_9PEZI
MGEWSSFPDYSPTRANDITSSIPSSDDLDFDSQDTMDNETEPRPERICPAPNQVGLRSFTTKKGPDDIFGARINRSALRPAEPAQKPPEPTKQTTIPEEHIRVRQKPTTSPQKAQSGAEKSASQSTWELVKHTALQKQYFPKRICHIYEWGRNNNPAVLLILLSWFTMFILAQTKILRVSAWEFSKTELKQENPNFYTHTGS